MFGLLLSDNESAELIEYQNNPSILKKQKQYFARISVNSAFTN